MTTPNDTSNPTSDDRRKNSVFVVTPMAEEVSMLPRLAAYVAFTAFTGGALSLIPRVPADRGNTTVEVRTFQFTPDTLRVSAGTRVEWTNGDDIEHTITAGTPEKRDTRLNGLI